MSDTPAPVTADPGTPPPPPLMPPPPSAIAEKPPRLYIHPGAAIVMGAAAVLGLAGDLLLRGTPWGINLGIWVLLLASTAAGLMFTRSAGVHGSRGVPWLLAAVAFAFLFALRASPVLQWFNVLAAAGCLAMVAFDPRSARARLAGTWEWAAQGAMGLFFACAGAIPLVFIDADWRRMSDGSRSPRGAAVVRGLAIAVPLLLVFGALFASADVFFSDLLESAVPVSVPDLLTHVMIALAVAWFAGGILWEATLSRRDPVRDVPNPRLPFGRIEVALVLGLLDALFLAFVAIQFRYLFGGEGRVEDSSTLTYAQYARRGFFELVTVAALVVPVILTGHWLARGRADRLFAALSGILVLLVIVVMASAVQRMRLYVDTYGLTELRFYTTAFMGWLFLVLLWLAVTVLRGQRDRFPLGAVVAGLGVLVALNAINPDGIIASNNLEATSERPIDVGYVSGLSDDAVPAMVSKLDDLPERERCQLAGQLLRRETAPGDWRSWNLGRWRAEQKLEGVRGC